MPAAFSGDMRFCAEATRAIANRETSGRYFRISLSYTGARARSLLLSSRSNPAQPTAAQPTADADRRAFLSRTPAQKYLLEYGKRSGEPESRRLYGNQCNHD